MSDFLPTNQFKNSRWRLINLIQTQFQAQVLTDQTELLPKQYVRHEIEIGAEQ